MLSVDRIISEYQTLKRQYQHQKHQLHQQQKEQQNQSTLQTTSTPNNNNQSTPNNLPNPSYSNTSSINHGSSDTAVNPAHSLFFIQQITPLIQTNNTSSLYSLSHKLIHLFPEDEHSFFAIGCYYWCINKLDAAQRFLRRCVKYNRHCAEAWILLGHIYSANEETEQALAAYRTAVRLLPQHKLPLICLSKELLHSGNYWLAAHMLQSAITLDPSDLLILNEMALIAVKMGNLHQGEYILKKAIGTMKMMQRDSSCTCEVSYDMQSPLYSILTVGGNNRYCITTQQS